MRLFNRHKEPEQVCPNCAVLVSATAVECDVCGWDLREMPEHASKPMEEASTRS